MQHLPRVLVFGQPFNDYTGGGITLSNLFKGWPKDKIASLWAPWDDSVNSDEVCAITYKIGRRERKWSFPFWLYKRPFPPSGNTGNSLQDTSSNTFSKTSFKNWLTNKIVNPLFIYLGLYHTSSTISISPELKKWLVDFDPEILYFQVSSLEGIVFVKQLIDFLQVPSAIHMMDDWPSTISLKGLFKNFWNKRIDRKFRLLLEEVDLCLSISDSMSEEYSKRYKKVFVPFHNPVDLSSFYSSTKFTVDENKPLKVLYLGRVGTANEKSIISFAKSISTLNSVMEKLEFHVYSRDFKIASLKRLENLSGVYINPPVTYNKVPDLLVQFNLLLLPLDFTVEGLKFSKLSFPTKATEFMLSGIPILVFAPADTELSKYFKKNLCGFCLTQNSESDIRNALQYIISHPDEQRTISRKATKIARENFDAIRVRNEFMRTLTQLRELKKE